MLRLSPLIFFSSIAELSLIYHDIANAQQLPSDAVVIRQCIASAGTLTWSPCTESTFYSPTPGDWLTLTPSFFII